MLNSAAKIRLCEVLVPQAEISGKEREQEQPIATRPAMSPAFPFSEDALAAPTPP